MAEHMIICDKSALTTDLAIVQDDHLMPEDAGVAQFLGDIILSLLI